MRPIREVEAGVPAEYENSLSLLRIWKYGNVPAYRCMYITMFVSVVHKEMQAVSRRFTGRFVRESYTG
jgi:hypothetical protein